LLELLYSHLIIFERTWI